MRVIQSCLRHAIPLWALAALNLPVGVAAEPQARVLKAEGSGSLTSVAFSADGRLLAQTEHSLVRLWDLKAGKVLRSWNPPDEGVGELHSVTFSPDGKRLAVAGADYSCAILVYDPVTGKLLWRKQTRRAAEVRLSFSPDGKWLLSTGDFSRGKKENILTVWRAADGELHRELEGTPMLNNEVPIAFAPDGKTVAAVSDRGKVVLWDIESGKAAPEIRVGKAIYISALAFSPDGKVLAVGTTNSVFLWDLPGGKPLRVFTERKDVADDVYQRMAHLLQFSADGAAVFAFLDGKLQAWDVKTGEARKAPVVAWSRPSAYSADRKALASGFDLYQLPE
jgi:Tol biopolymer transport system component